MQLIDLQAQQQQIKDKIDQRIQNVLHHGQFIMGPEIQQLEQLLSEYVGVKHCITCGNGTDALQLALMANDIGPSHIVFTTAFSFFATAEAIAITGAAPFFVDVNEQTYNICTESLENAIQTCERQFPGKARAVIAVDIFGYPAEYDSLKQLCNAHDLLLFEDAAQSFGASYNGKKACSHGDVSCTSFFPAKPLGCYGDGGACFTNDDNIANRLRSLRVHGQGSHKYDNVRIGMNSRLDTLQAAILLEKLPMLDEEQQRRNYNANFLSQRLAEFFVSPQTCSNVSCAYAQYTLRAKFKDRADILAQLEEAGIPFAIYYDRPLNQQTALKNYPSNPTPVANKVAKEVFSIPCHAYLSEADLKRIVSVLTR